VLGAFEEAEKAASEADRERYMTFVVVGGGPTGAEMAGSIAELARRVLACDFDHIDPRRSHIILVEAADRLLGGLPAPLGEKAADYLRELGVDVRLRVRVTGIEVGCVHTDAGAIPTETTIWAAGVQASPAARWLGSESDRQGRVIVKPDLSVEGHPEVFVIGDTAHFAGKDGKPLPGVAPVALQQGTFLGEVLRARLDEQPSPVFEYRDKGDLATVGRRRAVARIGDRHFTGRLAWLIWVFVHIMELATFRNRLVVLIQWIWGYFTWERGARLIVEDRSPARRADDARAQQSDL
jgi:NADH:ubiquinone reductase (H+-translocating)